MRRLGSVDLHSILGASVDWRQFCGACNKHSTTKDIKEHKGNSIHTSFSNSMYVAAALRAARTVRNLLFLLASKAQIPHRKSTSFGMTTLLTKPITSDDLRQIEQQHFCAFPAFDCDLLLFGNCSSVALVELLAVECDCAAGDLQPAAPSAGEFVCDFLFRLQ